jgi:tetratricopeptide (TPR) repeat protein
MQIPHLIPENLGRCVEWSEFESDSALTLHVIASQVGYPPDVEERIWKILEVLHQLETLDYLFINADTALKGGQINLQEDLDKWRKIPDPKTLLDSAIDMLQGGLVSAAFVFGLSADPRVSIIELEDWNAWAAQRDALRVLNATAGKHILLESYLTNLLSHYQVTNTELESLFALIRLEWTGWEWQEKKSVMERIQPKELLLPFAQELSNYKSVVRQLIDYKTQAQHFYDASATRVISQVQQALNIMRRSKTAVGALVVSIPWVDAVIELLKKEGVRFTKILPLSVFMGSILDRTQGYLNDPTIEEQKLIDAFSPGEVSRTRIEILQARPDELSQKRATDWATAAHALASHYERHGGWNDLIKAEQCIETSLELWDASASSWWSKGEILFLKKTFRASLESFEKANSLEPYNPTFIRARARALEQLEQIRDAQWLFFLSIYIAPTDGNLWGFLAEHYYNHGKRLSACYCWKKGQLLGDANCARNYTNMCGYSSVIFGCPIGLLPPFILFAHTGIQLVRSEEARLLLGIRTAALVLVATGIYGAYFGAKAGGILGGAVGFILSALSAALFIISVTISLWNADLIGSSLKSKTATAIEGFFFFMVGAILMAVAGSNLFRDLELGGVAWTDLRRDVGIILGTAFGGFLGTAIFFILSAMITPAQVRSGDVPIQPGDAPIILGTSAVVAVLTAAGIYGAYFGAKAGGILGGAVGFTLSALSAVLFLTGTFISLFTVAGAMSMLKSKTATAIEGFFFFMVGAILMALAGNNLFGDFKLGGIAWTDLRRDVEIVLGTAFGGFLGTTVFFFLAAMRAQLGLLKAIHPNLGIRTAAVALVTASIYGAYFGGKIDGFWGGIIGLISFVLSAVFFLIGTYLSLVGGAGIMFRYESKMLTIIQGSLFFMVGAIVMATAGSNLFRDLELGGVAWMELRRVVGITLGTAFGGFLGTTVFFLFSAAFRRDRIDNESA